MRIGVLVPKLGGGGAEIVAQKWIDGLALRGHQIVCLTYSGSAGVEGVRGAARYEFPGHTRWARLLSLPRWIRRTVAEERCDVVLSIMTFSNLALLVAYGWRYRRPALIISEHNVPSALLPDEGVPGRLKMWCARRIYRRADAAIAVSHAVAGDLRFGFRIEADRIWVLPNPVTSGLGLTRVVPQRAVLMFVGRLVPQKCPELLVETIVELQVRGIDASGIVIGDGPLRSRMELAAQEAGVKCEFRGWLSSWQTAAPVADCLLIPSSVEGLGNVLIEAAAIGLPVVACSRALGVADAVIPGVTGTLSPSLSPSHLGDAVVEAMALPTQGAGWDGWLSWFSVTNSCDRLEQVLSASMQSHQGRLQPAGRRRETCNGVASAHAKRPTPSKAPEA